MRLAAVSDILACHSVVFALGVGVSDSVRPGLAAIEATLAAVYPDQDVEMWPTELVCDAAAPLDYVRCYRVTHPTPHWHYITLGLSDLDADHVANPDDEAPESGFGFEFTFRLADLNTTDPDAIAPSWPVAMLQNLAARVFSRGRRLRVRDAFNTNGPINPEDDSTVLTGFACVSDPQLRWIATPSGSVEFLQLIGTSQAERKTAKRSALLKELLGIYPLGVTVMWRPSLR